MRALLVSVLVAAAFLAGVVVGARATWGPAQRAAVLAVGPVCPPVLAR